MRYWAPLLGVVLGVWGAGAEPMAPEALLLARIKYHAAQNLEKLPNYTCLETIERSLRRTGSRRFELVDVLRLEVALVDGKEMFAWPGSQQFEESEITKLVKHGAIGNGSFALHVRGVFLSQTARFTYVGEEDWKGRKVVHFRYDVPLVRSGYTLRVRPLEGVVGYRGSVWMDKTALDLLRMEIDIYDIPPHLPVKGGHEVLEYARVKIGERDFLLPQGSELTLTDSQGNENRNRMRFTNCRQFAGESVLSFDDAPTAEAAVERKAPERVVLPGDVELELQMEGAIEPGVAAVGDAVKGTVVKDVKRKGELVLAKGAKVSGRLMVMKRESGARDTYWSVGILWNRFELGNQFGELRARLIVGSLPGMYQGFAANSARPQMMVREQPLDDPHIGILYIRGDKGKIPSGLRTYWRTDAPVEERP